MFWVSKQLKHINVQERVEPMLLSLLDRKALLVKERRLQGLGVVLEVGDQILKGAEELLKPGVEKRRGK
jgi:hypothetical protein